MAWGEQGSSRRWRTLRRRILNRDSNRCQLRLDGCRTRATDVHHLTAWHGDPADANPADLCAACHPCNVKAGDPRGTDPAPAPRTQW